MFPAANYCSSVLSRLISVQGSVTLADGFTLASVTEAVVGRLDGYRNLVEGLTESVAGKSVVI